MLNIELPIHIGQKRCTKCGAPLHPGFRTCQKCGAPVSDQSEEGQPASAPVNAAGASLDAETVIGVIANATLARGFGRKTYNLVVTNRRIIGAEITSKMIAAEAERVAREAKARGENFMMQMSKRALAGINLYERYYTLPPEQIMAENKENWSLPIGDISACQIDEADGGYPSKLTLASAQGKQTFSLDPNTLGSGRVLTKDALAMLAQAGLKLR